MSERYSDDVERQQMVTLLGSVFEREKDSDVLDGIDMLKRQGWGNGRAYYLYLMPIHNHHEDARPLMLGVHLMLEDDFDTQKPRIIDIGLGANLRRRLSFALPNSSRRLSNNLKRSLSFMARHSQDVASPQLSTTPTIVSPPRSSRSPSLSQVIVKSKPLVIPTRSQHSISNLNLPRNSPPPDFLLDDDPFANLTGFGSGGKVCRQATTGDKHSPRSRLVNNNDNNYEPLPELDEALPKSPPSTSRSIPTSPTPTNFSGFRGMGMRSSFPSIASLSSSAGWTSQPQPQPQPQPPAPPQHPSLPSSSSSSSPISLPHRPSPAHRRPAFKSRPSLPSLNTLAKINFVPGFGVRKVRKGKVGAGLPLEPWNNLGSISNSSGEASPVEEEDETLVETGGKPMPPLPVTESASTSEHELGHSKSSFPPRSSSFSVPPSLSSSHTGPDMSPPPTSLGLDSVVYGNCDRSGKLRSPPRSPPSAAPQLSVLPPPPPPKSALPSDRMPPTSASSVELDVTHGRDVNKVSSPKETLEVGPHPILALRHDDVQAYDDDDADQFMDQFMEHYDRLDQEEDDASRQDQEGPSQEDVMVSLGNVDKRVVVDEDGDEIQMQPPPQPWSSLPATSTSPAISLVDVASVSSSETLSTSATLTAFPRTSSPILASDDSSLFDSYSYTYPYPSSRQNGEMGLKLKSSSASIPSATDMTSATWSTSESASVSRSRSFSSTYTSLSFGSESETSSCPQSSVDGDDVSRRYSSGIQHPLPPPSSQQQQPPMLVKSPADSVLHATEVSVLGSPPALSMPFSGNEDIGYIVPVPGVPGLFSNSSVYRGGRPLSFAMELSTRDDDSTSTATYLAYHDEEGDSDVHVEDGAGSDPHQASQHTDLSKIWMGQSEVKDEVLSQKREEGIMRKKRDLTTEVKTAVKATEANVEWEYIIGDRLAANNGRLNGHGLEGGRHAIAIVTQDAVSSEEPVNDKTKLATTSRYSPPLLSATSQTTPAMTLSTSHVLLKDDLTCGSSTAVAAALAMSSWKQDTSELGEGFSYSSTHKSSRSVSHAVLVDDDHDGKRRRGTTALGRGGRKDLSSFLAISSGSSSSSSNDNDDDHYGPVNSSSPSQSQTVVNVNLRTQLSSRTPPSSISATPPGYMSPPPRASAVSRSNGSRYSKNEEEDDDDDDEDDDDDQNEDDDDEDDDIPLAKRIPGALTAQKSIRRQVRQEREKKKQEKILRSHAETTRTRLMTLRPGANSHDTTTAAAAVVDSQTIKDRNSRTLTRNGSRSLNPFSPEDLVRKRDINGLDGVEAAMTSPSSVDATSLYQQQSRLRSKSMTRSMRDVRPSSTTETLPPVPILQSRPSSSQAQRTKSVKEPSSSPYHYPTSPSPTPINSTYAPSSMTPLRPMRSFHFHRPSIDRRPIGMDDPRSVPLPLDAEKRTSRNSNLVTRSRPSTRDGPQQPQQQQPQPSTFPTTTSTHLLRSLSRSRSSIERTSPATNPEPVPPIPMTARISHDADKHSRTPSRQHRPVPSAPSPADPLPMMMNSKPELVVQQRVFIGNMQRFNMVEIGSSTTAGDVIEMIEAEGSFKDFAGSGGWMVFEVAQDFGMERPIRSFELVADVQSSWNKDKMVNYLVLRMTPLEVPLNRSAIPSSSPTHSGYVEWEAKRGKWCKRFIQLREHSIWISKRDTGYEQVLLCSLSNFDAYQVTRTHRAPKPFAFAVKSTDNLSFFENTADYLHSFACSEKDGKIWMEKILVARSYVLFQERHVLFNPKTVSGNASGVSRSGTRKATIQRPHHDFFEPGSLLSKQL